MNTPIYDFISQYSRSGTARFHVPGHKGLPVLGPEPFDLTEIKGADSLYEANGIIAQSERNAASLFGTAATFYSTEGSSLCIRAMLMLLIKYRPVGTAPVILAARNVHQSFIYTASLLDFDVEWMYPEASATIVSCLISPSSLDHRLSSMPQKPAAVFVTSPDYLGRMQDLAPLADVCHRHGTRLAVDNAHGAYMHFMPKPDHPMDLGADICCDSAHKTLPVLTGGAYLHLAASCPADMILGVRSAMSLFGSTSPSYLTLASLDLCNQQLSTDFPEKLRVALAQTGAVKQALRKLGWPVYPSDPLRISLRTNGLSIAERLRSANIEPEYADTEHVVLMTGPCNRQEDFDAVAKALGPCDALVAPPDRKVTECLSVLRMHDILTCSQELIPIEEAAGRICADPSVHCPPGVPIVMPGERIESEYIPLFQSFRISHILVVK